MDDLPLISLLGVLVPLVMTSLAIRIGSRQVREFHERTSDNSLLAKITALSRFNDEKSAPPSVKVAKAPARRRAVRP